MTRCRALATAVLLAAGVLAAAFAAARLGAPDATTGIEGATGEPTRSVQVARIDLVAGGDLESAPTDRVAPTRTVAAVRARRSRGADSATVQAAPAPIRVPLRVSVVDEFGAPVAGARVLGRITCASPFATRASRATTDELGRAELESEACLAAALAVEPASDDRLHDRAEQRVQPCVDRVVITLPTRHWLRLQVVDRAGSPVTAIDRITIDAPSRSGFPRESNSTSATGAYEIEVGADAGVVQLSSARCGTAEYAYDPTAASTMRARIVLEREAALQVRVLRNGAPAAGVRVALGQVGSRDCGRIEQALYGRIGSRGDHFFAEQTSAADGWAEFAIDRPGEYVVLAESIDVGTGSAAVSFDRLGRTLQAAVELGDGVALDMLAIDAHQAPVPGALVQLFGPGNTRRIATADGDGRCRAVAMPPGPWSLAGARPGRHDRPFREAIVVDVEATRAERIDVPTEALARLAVATSAKKVELYADGCPPIRIEPQRPTTAGVVLFESDHVGRHLVVVRETLHGRDAVVHLLDVDLDGGDNELRVECAPRDAHLEVVAGMQFDDSKYWLRTSTRSGAAEFHALGKSTLRDKDERTRRMFAWAADVPAGGGDLVHVDLSTGVVEVVAGDLSFASGESRRVVLEGFGK